ncbi:hypothetical protein TKK_0001877 [Trichogramma kaykai]|uniref:Peptidase M3A/M3B catalytic domain-containing protein n=1 Tax=Trichogramma kaykai TaxID=54128 RepID=A0ABD2XFM6_9HYME
MAAALRCGRRLLNLRNQALANVPKRCEGGFYVLLPEIGDIPDKYPLLKEETMLPEFNHFTIEKCFAAIGKQALELEQIVSKFENDLDTLEDKDIFEDVLEPIENMEMPLQMTLGISKVLYYGNQSLMPTKYYLSIHKRAWAAVCHKFYNKKIYEACKKVLETKKNLTEEQERILKKYVLEGKFYGLELTESERKRLHRLINQINNSKEEFRQKLEIGTNMFKHKITDPHQVKGLPDSFLKQIAADPKQFDSGPWIITLNPEIVKKFLEYCPDPMLRWNIWLANNLRCSKYGDDSIQTSSLVDNISADKTAMAKMLGFNNYSEMSMATKMVGSLENVHKFMNTLLQAAYPRQVEEMNQLSEFAQERGYDKIEQWDVPYWARKQRKTIYNYDDEILHEYFPLPNVLQGLFDLTKRLFNVEIVERERVDVWHRNVRFFDVYDLDISTTDNVGSFYLDSYAQSGNQDDGYVLLLRNKSQVHNNKALSSMINNFERPGKDGGPSFISFAAVQLLFGNFGHLLQQILTRVRSSEVAGLSNVEWDATGLSRSLMVNFVFEGEVLRNISSHYETGEPLNDQMIQSIISSRNHLAGYRLCQELYLSKFDLELHSQMRPWEKIMKQVWKEHFVFPEDKKDSHPCSWDDVFISDFGAAYFCDLYSRMLAADAYNAFREVPGDDEVERRKIGLRFKDTVLSLGGSVHASEVFRRFRGRDPCEKAFIKSLELD